MSEAPGDAHLYCCGPAPMLDAFMAATASRPTHYVHLEHFSAPTAPVAEGGFVVELARSKLVASVQPGQTILEALRVHGVEVPSSCEQGVCDAPSLRMLR